MRLFIACLMMLAGYGQAQTSGSEATDEEGGFMLAEPWGA